MIRQHEQLVSCLKNNSLLSGRQRTEIERILRIEKEADDIRDTMERMTHDPDKWLELWCERHEEAEASAKKFIDGCGWYETEEYRRTLPVIRVKVINP